MDFLEAMVYLMVLYIAVLFPLAGWMWIYLRPWLKELWKDIASMRKLRAKRRAYRRIERKRREVYRERARGSMHRGEKALFIYEGKGEK